MSFPYTVRPIPFLTCRDFVSAWHYAKGIHNGPSLCTGLFDAAHELVGVIAFATPGSENVRASIFGAKEKSRVTELSRLVVLDTTPHSTESWFIARSMDLLKHAKPHLWAVVSFADRTYGHVGTVYQASNAYYYGRAKPETYYIDETGRRRQRRQCGVNISVEEARRRGWEVRRGGPKERYCLLLPDDKWHARKLPESLQITPLWPYPKLGYTRIIGQGGQAAGTGGATLPC